MRTYDNSSKYVLNYSEPASVTDGGWEKYSLPIGNGLQGCNIFGGIPFETLYFSEESLWTGGPVAQNGVAVYKNADAYGLTNSKGEPIRYQSVKKASEQALSNDNEKITKIFREEILPGDRKALGCFQAFAICTIDFNHGSKAREYCRWLDIDNAIAGVDYRIGDDEIHREYFANYPDRVICAGFSANGKMLPDLKVSISIPHIDIPSESGSPAQFSPKDYGKIITMHQASDHYIEISGYLRQNGLKFALHTHLLSDGIVSARDGSLYIENAKNVEIYFIYRTDYANDYKNNYRNGEEPLQTVRRQWDKIKRKSYDCLKAEHLADYRELFGRVTLSLGGEREHIHTDRLLGKYRYCRGNGYLEEMFFQYGRYLLISSSRENSLPANLQGVWNAYMFPPWSSDYHLNVNLQMNYWLSTRTNLIETAYPVLDFVEKLKEPGKLCASALFGLDNNWCFMLVSNIFGFTGLSNAWDTYAGGFPTWATTCYAWICHSLYELYTFTGDIALLRERIFPLLKDCVDFYRHILVYDRASNRMVISPSYSAEHGGMFAGATFEQELVWQVFEDYLDAVKSLTLGESEEVAQIAGLQKQLKPLRINSKTGCIEEWYDEENRKIPNVEKHHRHLSHLIGVFPGTHVSPQNEEIFSAAKKTLRRRGKGGTGWSRAYKICMYAACFDGKEAYGHLRRQLKRCVLPNLLNTHPPFQIDGNFGATAGIAEMLVQMRDGKLYPLSAIPKFWAEGSVSGLTLQGGITVDIVWEKHRLRKMDIRPAINQIFTIVLPEPASVFRSVKGSAEVVNIGNFKEFKAPVECGVNIELEFVYA